MVLYCNYHDVGDDFFCMVIDENNAFQSDTFIRKYAMIARMSTFYQQGDAYE